MNTETISALLDRAVALRETLFDSRHESAFRLFNGFSEGEPRLVIDIYAGTAVIGNYADPSEDGVALAEQARSLLLERLTWLRAVVLKSRNSPLAEERNGILIHGDKADRRVKEHGVSYAVDICANRDAGFFPDTRNLREWLIKNMDGKTVLNTFAYTGSMGVAAMAGGAVRVVQTDMSRNFLNVAKTSCSMNGFPIVKKDFMAGDFFTIASRLKRWGERFDCVLLDPPFFAVTDRGTVDQLNSCDRLINKVRPLINDGGYLVSVNNALFLSGSDYMSMLEKLCSDGYLEIAELISVPSDFSSGERNPALPDPAPFNHATKIAVLRVKRKSE